jgi:hypothetical protein
MGEAAANGDACCVPALTSASSLARKKSSGCCG